ncbi:TatD family [Corynascus similis CBS 632.67]
MCQQDSGQTAHAIPDRTQTHDEPFPWHIGVYDAHCHPTDTMSSIASVQSMQARALTIMATRSQDQDLVVSVAAKSGIRDRSAFNSLESQNAPEKVVPAFGWHPWFSYQLYDDTDTRDSSTSDTSSPTPEERKATHYRSVLSPQPDEKFIASLPDPIPLSTFLADTRQRILNAGGPALIGEVGLDKAFRLPWPWNHPKNATATATAGTNEQLPAAELDNKNDDDDGTAKEKLTPGGREGRMLSPHHVKMAHQVAVLKAQLRLAGQLGVAVSVHGVQAHGVLFDALAALWKGHEKEVVSRRKQRLVAKGAEDFSSSEEEDGGEEDDLNCGEGGTGEGKTAKKKKGAYKPMPFPPRVCLHSFSGSAQMVHQYLNPAIPVRVFFSFSTVINLSTAGGESKFPDVVRACPDDRLLVESDLHCAGEEMDRVLEDISRRVCEIKGWTLEDGLARIRKNYEEFIFG